MNNPKNIIRRIRTEKKILFLTFDDGPHKRNTEEILDILKKESVKAGFFLSGTEVEKYPGIAQKIFNQGHEIGNHGYEHQSGFFSNLNYILKDIKKTDRSLIRLKIAETLFYRPPYLRIPFSLLLHPSKLLKKIILADVSVKDFQIFEPEVIIKRILAKIRPGSIILLHDNTHNNKATIKALPALISEIHERGYRFNILSEFIT